MIETIYNDFSTKLLPKVAEGLTITKDYFLDLFGRYVKYLIVIDSLYTIIGLAGMIITLIIAIKLWKNTEKYDDFKLEISFITIFSLSLLGTLFFISVSNLTKDIYIPEIRVYEELKEFIK